MDLQTMGDNALTSENALSHNNLRAHSPQTAGDSRPQPDTPIGLEESWRNANSCARCRSPGCAVPYIADPSPNKDTHPSWQSSAFSSIPGSLCIGATASRVGPELAFVPRRRYSLRTCPARTEQLGT